MTRVAIIGGGITGLAAAYEAARRGADVVVCETGARFGGSITTSPFAGCAVDEAADAFLARVPEGIELCRELGIDGELVSPAARRANVFSHGALRPLPEHHVLGVPTDLDELAATGIVSSEAVERARADLRSPGQPPIDDETIGSFVRRRLGDEVLERLVDPLVGGINAGDTDDLSMSAVVPQIDAAARSDEPSLIRACAAQRAKADPTSPVFFAPRGGMGRIIDVLVERLGAEGAELVTSDAATSLDPSGRSVSLASGRTLDVDGVVITTPAAHAARLVRDVSADAAGLLAGIPAASVALVTLQLARDSIERELDGSGYLVPRPEGTLLTACSWASSKWAHLDPGDGTVLLRASVGRAGDDRALQLDDDALVGAVLADLRRTMGALGDPGEVRVSRWIESFPQYRSGHLARVAAIEQAIGSVTSRVLVTGASFRGLGVPACIRQGRAAARQLL